ncbi:MAG: hypothetical protein V1692_01180 [bacterium]
MNTLFKNLHWLIGEIIKDIFRISLVTLIIFFALETFEPGLVSNHLSFNSLLVFTLAFGIITAVWHGQEEEIGDEYIGEEREEKTKEKEKNKKIGRAYFQGFVFGLIAMVLIGWQTVSLGLFGYILSLLAGLIIVLIFGLVKSGE